MNAAISSNEKPERGCCSSSQRSSLLASASLPRWAQAARLVPAAGVDGDKSLDVVLALVGAENGASAARGTRHWHRHGRRLGRGGSAEEGQGEGQGGQSGGSSANQDIDHRGDITQSREGDASLQRRLGQG